MGIDDRDRERTNEPIFTLRKTVHFEPRYLYPSSLSLNNVLIKRPTGPAIKDGDPSDGTDKTKGQLPGRYRVKGCLQEQKRRIRGNQVKEKRSPDV